MPDEKNRQQARAGDTAFMEQEDIAKFMNPGRMEKKVENSESNSGAQKPGGIKTPGSPRL